MQYQQQSQALKQSWSMGYLKKWQFNRYHTAYKFNTLMEIQGPYWSTIKSASARRILLWLKSSGFFQVDHKRKNLGINLLPKYWVYSQGEMNYWATKLMIMEQHCSFPGNILKVSNIFCWRGLFQLQPVSKVCCTSERCPDIQAIGAGLDDNYSWSLLKAHFLKTEENSHTRFASAPSWWSRNHRSFQFQTKGQPL